MSTDTKRNPLSGRFSPLRYPGGKGKLAKFVANVVQTNGLQDGLYVEPYAGGAAVAWELLLTGIVRRVHINDLSRPIYAFWHSVINKTDELSQLVYDKSIDVSTWKSMKHIFMNPNDADDLALGFAAFYLNRTNRSGILNGGPIGGHAQTGAWGIDARFNKRELIERIEKIATMRRRIELTNLDAAELLNNYATKWPQKTLLYLDPPYFEKGPDLYYNSYKNGDHLQIATLVKKLREVAWLVSYDDVAPIQALYTLENWLQYSIGYSARSRTYGREAMFFSRGLRIPPVQGSMIEIDRWQSSEKETFYRAPQISAA